MCDLTTEETEAKTDWGGGGGVCTRGVVRPDVIVYVYCDNKILYYFILSVNMVYFVFETLK